MGITISWTKKKSKHEETPNHNSRDKTDRKPKVSFTHGNVVLPVWDRSEGGFRFRWDKPVTYRDTTTKKAFTEYGRYFEPTDLANLAKVWMDVTKHALGRNDLDDELQRDLALLPSKLVRRLLRFTKKLMGDESIPGCTRVLLAQQQKALLKELSRPINPKDASPRSDSRRLS